MDRRALAQLRAAARGGPKRANLRPGAVLAASLACTLGAAEAVADAGRDIARTCENEWFLPRAVCACVAEQAVARFNEVQLKWLALPAGYPQEAAAPAKAMTVGEAQAVTQFMVSAPQQCEAT